MNSDSHYEEAIEAGLSFLRSIQKSDGSFPSSAVMENSGIRLNSPTLFTTSLVLRALRPYKENPVYEAIAARGINLLKKSQNASGTWNYWLHDSDFYTAIPYPDDLDDTSLALQNIFFYTTESHPIYLAQFIKTLTQYEIEEGGPYGTWCINTDNAEWKDCDIIVNANIAAALSPYDIVLPNLVAYFEKKIIENDLQSSYYLSTITSLYFISASYAGILQKEIVARLTHLQHTDGTWGTPLYTALALTTLSRLRVDLQPYADAIRFLIRTQRADGSWDAEPFFIERKTAQGIFLWSSSAWTTAAVLEALACYTSSNDRASQQKGLLQNSPENSALDEKLIDTLLTKIKKEDLLWHTYTQSFIDILQKTPFTKDAVLFPRIFYTALTPKDSITSEVLDSIGIAHVLGIVAYTVFDKILDGEMSVSYLPYMNWCLRTFIDTYTAIGGTPVREIVHTTLTIIEKAQQTEQDYRGQLLTGKYTTKTLPKIHNIPTYEKSIGYALPCVAIALLSNTPHLLPHVWSFFQSFLTARQLHDDAHDVVDDLHHGTITIPVRLVLARIATENPAALLNVASIDAHTIQKFFWEDAFEVVSDRIARELATARTALDDMRLVDRTYFDNLIETLLAIHEKTISERMFMREFLTAY